MEEQASSLEKFHWVATQALSLTVALRETPDLTTLELARQVAKRNLQHGSIEEQAWSHATLAELEMIDATLKAEKNQTKLAPEDIESVVEHCKCIVSLMGLESFHVESTRRQFRRYLRYWPDRPWKEIAEKVVETLSSTSEQPNI